MNNNRQLARYLIADFLSACIAWSLFFLYRTWQGPASDGKDIFDLLSDPLYWLGMISIPVFWLLAYWMMGAYRNVYRKARLQEFGQTLLISVIGVLVLFFVLILDDFLPSNKSYDSSFFVLFSLHFGFTYLFRLILTSITVYRIQHKIIGFNTIIVGSNGNAISVFHEIEKQERSSGNKFVGFIHVDSYEDYKIEKFLKRLGGLEDLKNIIERYAVEEVIIAIERSEHKTIERIITQLEYVDVIIKIIPDMQDFLLGTVKTESIFHTPLILVSPELMPAWQQSMKRLMDLFASVAAMVLLSPAYLFTAIGVKLSSKGPVIYSQERVGLRGKPFLMHKFRSMYCDAEKHGPMLSSRNDKRITPFGRFIRKVRLDEIPQFWSVLIGDMSLVGPRPERSYFIEQIVQKAPHYRLLHRIKPGITSWGQVKFGYAENVDEMIERLKYDILYLENMSLAMDIKILIYTFLIVVQGRGK